MSRAHDTPEYAAVRALGDLPALPGDAALPAQETPRAAMLAHDLMTQRSRQREQAQRQLSDWLNRIESAVEQQETYDEARRLNNWLFGAVLMLHQVDVLSYAEAEQWQRLAMNAMRSVR